MHGDLVASAIGQACLGEGHHPRTTETGKLAGRGNGCRLHAEQRHEQAALGAIILIRGIPDHATGAQHLEHAAHIIAFDSPEQTLFTAMTLDEIKQWVLVRAVHAVHVLLHAQKRAPHFQGGEVQSHEDHTLAISLGLTQMFQPLDRPQALETFHRPPPADGHLEKGHTGGSKILTQQTLALANREFRETQLQVPCGNTPTRTCQVIHQAAQSPPQRQQPAIRQLHHQPEQPHAQPQRPEARMQEIDTKSRTIHHEIRKDNKGAHSTWLATGRASGYKSWPFVPMGDP